jgi:hypothetical protein
MKQFQHRPKTRAPHGSPDFPARTGAWITEEQKKWITKQGGSAYLRELVKKDMEGNRNE